MQTQATASITPAKAAVASLVNLDNLNISAKEAQAASAASGAVRTPLSSVCQWSKFPVSTICCQACLQMVLVGGGTGRCAVKKCIL